MTNSEDNTEHFPLYANVFKQINTSNHFLWLLKVSLVGFSLSEVKEYTAILPQRSFVGKKANKS